MYNIIVYFCDTPFVKNANFIKVDRTLVRELAVLYWHRPTYQEQQRVLHCRHDFQCLLFVTDNLAFLMPPR